MRNVLLTGMMTVGALAAGAAFAQESKPVGLSAKVGLFWPGNSDARDAGRTWFSFGLEYKIGNIKFSSESPGYSSAYSISIDYLTKGDFRNTPVLLNYIGRKDNMYYVAGIGVGFTKVRVNNTETSSGTDLAYQFGIGYDFNQGSTPMFVEGKYIGSGESRLNGFAVFVGVRF